jgi:uncharacterized protein YcbX
MHVRAHPPPSPAHSTLADTPTRPNVILSGLGPAWSDDKAATIQVGSGAGVAVELVKPCSRCTVPLVDQSTGVVTGKEPIATMLGFRLVGTGSGGGVS